MSVPAISVVVPSYNRRDVLRRVLAAYERQKPADLPFEVVVVDDGSPDGTAEMLAELRPRRFALRFARQANQGPAKARNRAFSLARGELVLITGDDIEPRPNFLAEHWRGHEERPEEGAVILGLTLWPPGAELTATMRHIDGPGAQQFSYAHMRNGEEYDFRHLYTSNVSLKRRLLEREPAGFSADFSAAAFEDAELGYRLARHGARIYYRHHARAHHHHPYGAAAFFRRQERCGAMAVVLWRKWPQLEKWLSIGALHDVRLALLEAPPERRRAVRWLADGLEDWVHRAISLAAFFDPFPAPPVDGYLLDLFAWAYQKGLAEALYPEETCPGVARRLLAARFLDIFPKAAVHLADQARQRGLPCPRIDARALHELVRLRI